MCDQTLTNLEQNPDAKKRRKSIQFFDSADWAMNKSLSNSSDSTESALPSFVKTCSSSPPSIAKYSLLSDNQSDIQQIE